MSHRHRVPLKSMTIQYENYYGDSKVTTKIKASAKEELDAEMTRFLREYPSALYNTAVVETGYDAGKYYAYVERVNLRDKHRRTL